MNKTSGRRFLCVAGAGAAARPGQARRRRRDRGEAHNTIAGQAAVLLDIGGNVGAHVVRMPTGLDGLEVELHPVGHHDPDDHGHPRHVSVVSCPVAGGVPPSLVFGEVEAGDEVLRVKSTDDVRVRVHVQGGGVTEADWA